MDNIVNVTGGKGGTSFLILGDKKAALIDCGMAYCASNLISNIKRVLNTRALDYVLVSHSHYDHIGAVPYLREQWPDIKICGSEHDKYILNRYNALKTIKELSVQAAEIYGRGLFKEYNDEMMKIDTVISDGDIVDLGGLSIQVLETPGHTRCTLSFLVNNEVLFASESTGVMSQSGKVYPAFLISYSKSIDSINKCREINPKFIISPHFGLVNKIDALQYWEKCILAARESRDFILHLFNLGYGEERILLEYENAFQDEEFRMEQPLNAFRLNTRYMIKAVLNENCRQR
ncbi:MAG TPA: MBL fold metallo-hydrolase [Syntrophomonadaceae bacterium]|nr:MBL fold metallo-hydrolase [Syntrophomonadaceae bacterium]